MESDSHLTEVEQEVYEILKKKQDILAKAVKERSDYEKKLLRHYIYQLNKIKSNIIKDLLKKCPELRKQTKTAAEKRRRQAESAAERKSASRSRQDANIDNLKCQDCENGEVHICPLDELEDIETVNELNNERDDNEEYYDTQVVESDSVLTEEEKKVYEILKKKKDILSKAVKDRSDEDKKMLKHYINKLNRIKSKIIIPDLLKKCPELRQQTKTAAQLRSESRSRQDKQKK